MYRNQLQYLIHWTRYDSLTWEAAMFVDGLQAVEEFHQLYPKKPAPFEKSLGGPRAQEGDTVTVWKIRRYLGIMTANFWRCGRNCVTEGWRNQETRRVWRDGGGIICRDKEVVWGVATSNNVAWLYWYRVLLVVCKIMGWDSDGILEHEEWFEDDRWIVYKESVVGVEGFPLLLSLLVLLYKQSKLRLWNSFDCSPVLIPSKRISIFCLASRYNVIVTSITYAWPRPVHSAEEGCTVPQAPICKSWHNLPNNWTVV